MERKTLLQVYDFIIIGSGFGGSVAAMRLAEKGYRVLVLERGRRFRDRDYPKTNWNIWKFLWLPALRCFGIMQISPFQDVFVLHGSGVGGGSLVYAAVLEQPSDELFEAEAWKDLADWKAILQPHYETARRMLGVTPNPCLWPADYTLQRIAGELGVEDTFRPTEVGVYFGEVGAQGCEVPDPYFAGQGPPRAGCTHCGGCMIGCRQNAKNSLDKNYLYFAEQWGAEIRAESAVSDIRPLLAGQPDGARYEVVYHSSTGWLYRPELRARGRNVVVSAGTLGTLRLLFRCRDHTRSLPGLSPRLGSLVRSNNEFLLGITSRDEQTDYSEGIAISSIFHADPVTCIEPCRYPAGSSLMRWMSGPLIDPRLRADQRILATLKSVFTHFGQFARTHLLPGWAERTTILLVMQTEDDRLSMETGKCVYTLYKQNLISQPDPEHHIPCNIDLGHRVTLSFARKVNGVPAGSISEGLLNIPLTAHILGGVPMGNSAKQGVVSLDCQVHNYQGLFVVDGSIVPANPGVNPSLTIAAMAEYAMSLIQPNNARPSTLSQLQAA